MKYLNFCGEFHIKSMDKKQEFEQILSQLNLSQMKFEGGWFRQIYKSSIPSTRPGHSNGTSIYYALDSDSVSRFHYVDGSDEIWMYHAGSPAIQILLFQDGTWEKRIIGPSILEGQRPQSVIPANTWQAAILLDRSPGSWGLFGATVFPGFEDQDYHETSADTLFDKWPDAKQTIIDVGLNV